MKMSSLSKALDTYQDLYEHLREILTNSPEVCEEDVNDLATIIARNLIDSQWVLDGPDE